MFLGDVDGQIGIISMDMRETHLDIVTLALFCLNSHTIRRGAPDVVAELLHTVDIEFEVSATIHIHHIFTSLLRSKYRLVLGREILELYTGGKVVHTEGSNSQRLGVILRGNGLALHLTVVPERALHTFLTIEAALRGHQALHHLVVGQVTTRIID